MQNDGEKKRCPSTVQKRTAPLKTPATTELDELAWQNPKHGYIGTNERYCKQK